MSSPSLPTVADTATTTEQPSTITIETYAPKYKQAFRDLNIEWIERLFVVEAPDLKVLNDPEGQIINLGGQIFFAIDHDTHAVLGTVALLPHGAGVFEMAKMAVTPKAQNKKIGWQLGQALVQYAKHHGVMRIMLETNSSLKNSIHLYQKLGFQHVPLTSSTPYQRADVRMMLDTNRV